MKTNLKQLVTAALLFGGMLAGTASYAQNVPQKFNYQGVARDAKGNPIGKQTLGLKISVLAAEGATEAEYEEVQTVTTNEYGLYTLQIGAGTATKGEMKMVAWETGNKYIKVAIDPKGGTNYTDLGTTQLLSVPYAIYADRAGSAKNGGGSDRAGTVSTSAAGTGTVNFLTKFTGANTIYNSQVFDNGTNIGIGTTSPNAKVQITNTTTTPTELRINHTNTTGGASRLSFKNDNEAGFTTTSNFAILNKYASGTAGTAAPGYPFSNLFGFNNSRGNLLFSTKGSIGFGFYDITATPQVTVRMHIDSATGRVGMGTTNNFNTLNLQDANSDTTGISFDNGLDLFNISEDVNGKLQFSANNYNLSGGNTIMTLDDDGVRGVGIGTTSPAYKLDVNTNNGDYQIAQFTNNSSAGDQTALIGIQNGNGNKWLTGVGGTSNGLGLTNGQFYVEQAGSGARMVIDNTGRVGIGTNTPAAELSVTGTGEVVRITGDGTWLGFADNTGGYHSYLWNNTSNNCIMLSSNSKDVHIGSNGSGLHWDNATDRVGIGVGYNFTPQEKIHVNGNMYVSDSIKLGSVERISDVGAFQVGTNSDFVPETNNGASLGISSKRWSNIYLVNAPNVSSDARLKENVNNLNYGLETILKLRPVSYNLNFGHDRTLRLGLIAQELQKVVPEIVNDKEFVRDEKGNFVQKEVEHLTVRYEELIPVLIKATQEQQVLIEKLEKRIAELEKK